jgi:hypothetical protein
MQHHRTPKPSGAQARITGRLVLAWMIAVPAVAAAPSAAASAALQPTAALASPSALFAAVQVGDIVFTRIDVLPFREVAAATGTWTNHVGVVIGRDGPMPLVAESTFPRARITPMDDFVRRSQDGRVAVLRLSTALDAAAEARVKAAAERRLGVLYDTGFDLHSRRQFCSRFVHEVIEEAVGEPVGEVQTLAELFERNPQARLAFWRAWYLGSIPWSRQTITPASLLSNPRLRPVFDGRIAPNTH